MSDASGVNPVARDVEKARQANGTVEEAMRVNEKATGSSENRQRQRDDLLADLAIHGLLIFFAIWGVLCRLGLTALFTYTDTPVFPLLWSQIIGCALMGWFVAARYKPLYVGLTTGLCGSITTFSSFMDQVFLQFSNANGVSRSRGEDFLSGMVETILTLGMSLIALRFGVHVYSLFRRKESQVVVLAVPEALQRPLPNQRSLHVLSALLGAAFWLGSILLCAFYAPWRGEVTFALSFGPIGALARYWLSKLNPRVPTFPIGTFAANMLATALFAAFSLIQRSPGAGIVGCGVLQGLDDGLNGCLSTISTFATEVRSLRRWHAYRYVIVSWFVGQLLITLIYGIRAWSTQLAPKCAL